MKYLTDDGKEFKNIEEAKKHETRLKQEKERREELIKRKKERAKEVENAYKTYRELYDAYVNDYEEDFAYTIWGKLADWF